MPKLEIELTEEEYKDLEEIANKHYGGNIAEALKEMGLKTYRELKQATDRERRKPAVEGALFLLEGGIPAILPCAFVEITQKLGYRNPYEFVVDCIKKGLEELGKHEPRTPH